MHFCSRIYVFNTMNYMITPKLPPKVQIDKHIPTGYVIRGYTEKEMMIYALEFSLEYNKQLTRRIVELESNQLQMLKSLEWFVENDDTNIGMPGNEFWEDGLNEGIRVIALVKGEIE